MSTHCLICGNQDNWIPDFNEDVREVHVDNKMWIKMVIYNDELVDKPLSKKPIEGWYVHRFCMKKFIESRTEAETELKNTVNWADNKDSYGDDLPDNSPSDEPKET